MSAGLGLLVQIKVTVGSRQSRGPIERTVWRGFSAMGLFRTVYLFFMGVTIVHVATRIQVICFLGLTKTTWRTRSIRDDTPKAHLTRWWLLGAGTTAHIHILRGGHAGPLTAAATGLK